MTSAFWELGRCDVRTSCQRSRGFTRPAGWQGGGGWAGSVAAVPGQGRWSAKMYTCALPSCAQIGVTKRQKFINSFKPCAFRAERVRVARPHVFMGEGTGCEARGVRPSGVGGAESGHRLREEEQGRPWCAFVVG